MWRSEIAATVDGETPSVLCHPIRVILDPFLDIPPAANIKQTANQYRTIIFYNKQIEKSTDWETKNRDIEYIPTSAHEEYLDIEEILLKLGELKILSVLVESGPMLSSHLLKTKNVNRLYYFISPKIIGGTKNVYNNLNIFKLEEHIKLKNTNIEIINDDILYIGDL